MTQHACATNWESRTLPLTLCDLQSGATQARYDEHSANGGRRAASEDDRSSGYQELGK